MDKVLDYTNDEPNKALIVLLITITVSLSGLVIALWKEKKKEDVKNFNMLLKAVESFKDNAVALEGLKEKVDQLLRKYG